MTSKDEQAMTYFGERGFEFWTTGGGGTAFAARVGKCYVLLTDEGGMDPPKEGEPVHIGIYSDDLGEGIDYATAASFDEAVEKANALIARATLGDFE
jgi:hypothetical protein